jgi:very-short-patch-repair endonuclease
MIIRNNLGQFVKGNKTPWNKGMTFTYKQRTRHLDYETVKQMILNKCPVRKIAEHFGCSTGCLCAFAKANDFKFNNHKEQLNKESVKTFLRAKRMKQIFHKSNHLTYLEKKIKQILDEFSVKYTMQKNIDNRTLVDFFIEPNKCIYADGDYWHNKPAVINRDIKINEHLIDNGYLVYRYSEKEINKGIESNILRIIGDDIYATKN